MLGLIARALPDRMIRPVRERVALSRLVRSLKAHSVPGAPQKHPLPAELIVSLTSFPPRFRNLHLTLRSILSQTIRPDRVILWIAEDDAARLPRRVQRLNSQGLEIRTCVDYRSYKKLIFTLKEHPDAYIATADDDLFYTPDWLEALVHGSLETPGVVTCHRAHRVPQPSASGLPPYRSWPWNVGDEAARNPAIDLLPTGVGGVLYPPHCFYADVLRSELFMEFCPNADDLWFYWMARLAGTMHKKVGGDFKQILWPSSQDVALFNHNASQNDEQIKRMIRQYGYPNARPCERPLEKTVK